VHDAVAVRARERVGEVGEDAARLAPGEPPAQAQVLRQRGAAHVPHHEVPEPADLPEAVERDDAGVRELGDGARLAPEPLAARARLGQVGAQDLDRDGAVERALPREVHRAHAAAPERPHDVVLAPERVLEERPERRVPGRAAARA
jgi:hypothetical protein